MELAANPALDRHLIRATPRLSPDGYNQFYHLDESHHSTPYRFRRIRTSAAGKRQRGCTEIAVNPSQSRALLITACSSKRSQTQSTPCVATPLSIAYCLRAPSPVSSGHSRLSAIANAKVSGADKVASSWRTATARRSSAGSSSSIRRPRSINCNPISPDSSWRKSKSGTANSYGRRKRSARSPPRSRSMITDVSETRTGKNHPMDCSNRASSSRTDIPSNSAARASPITRSASAL